jgi:hypothetical protein
MANYFNRNYSYSYDKLKEVYKGIFGEENIIDKI